MINAKNLVGNNLPMPFGYGAAVVLSGSMEPAFSKGDLIIVKETDEYGLNDIVVFESENPSVATVTERGKIEAISAGTTNIVAKYGKASAVCSITVEWDNSYPVLIDVDGLEKSYIVFKNSSFISFKKVRDTIFS